MSTTKLVNECRALLSNHADGATGIADANPVRALAFELSRRLERDDISVDQLAEAAQQLCDAAMVERAQRLGGYSSECDVPAVLMKQAGGDPVRLKAIVSRAKAGIVFTAHPTFALSRELRAKLSGFADNPPAGAGKSVKIGGRHAPDDELTVLSEHEDILNAVEQAKNALNEAHAMVCDTLRGADPAGWKSVTPRLASIASWVGYDLDGRTDIHWSATIQIRLQEKALQLHRYAQRARELQESYEEAACEELSKFIELTHGAAVHTEAIADQFLKAGDDPMQLAGAANALTAEDPRRLTSKEPLLQLLSKMLGTAGDGDFAKDLWVLRAEVAGFGLGTAEIHLRVNAAQIRNAARADFDIDPDSGGFGRVALDRAAEHAGRVKPEKVNFASVFLEKATARRQIMLAAQIRKHIDADAPIRFLIAELESPVTVVAAVYLARRYGVAEIVDISPLFETARGLEGGGRLMAQLLDEPVYLDYARMRGRIAVQIGFSDAGRYMGQLTTSMAAERLQILIARALARREIRDLEVVVFNTHGESMGRGAHPKGMQARMAYLLTPWTAARFEHERITIVHETSFQGGDGVLHFATPALARHSLQSILAARLSLGEAVTDDRFYSDLDFSWDFYRALKSWQEDLSESPDVGAALTAFGPNLLFKTGSRPVKRASGGRSDIPSSRALRAIPHNAILQQLAAPANVATGVGAAAAIDPDRCVDWATGSHRARAALEMAARARGLTSIAVLRSYSTLFDPTFWTTRAYESDEAELRGPAGLLGRRLECHGRFAAYARLANQFAGDLARFDDVIERLPDLLDARDASSAAREDMELLQAIRLALLMRLFLLSAKLPTFSDRFDITRDDLVDLVLDLQIEEAVDLLDKIFPEGGNGAALMKAIDEPAEASVDVLRGYPHIQREIVNPMRELITTIREIGVGVSHLYSAYG